MKSFYEYTVVFFNLSPISNHLHPLQVKNCDSNLWLVVDEDDNVKSGLKHHCKSLKTDLIFLQPKCFRMNITMKLVYQFTAIFFTFSRTSSHIHPLQVENCDSNSRLVVDKDDNGKFRPERVKGLTIFVKSKGFFSI